MLLDGGLVAQEQVAEHTRATLDAVDGDADALGDLAPVESRAVWIERLHLIGRDLDPTRYADARFVAERLQRMTAGRRRIELRAEHVDLVRGALVEWQPGITAAAPGVVRAIRQAITQQVPSHHLPG
jgi:hypothetical protein